MIIVICGLLTVALQIDPVEARGSAAGCAPRSTIRASRAGLGINVPQVFAFTFAFGCGLGRPRRRA